MANWIESNGDLEQLSGVETFKNRSGGLYGPVGDELAQPTDHFSDESVQILKFHGSYQQDNRDTRKARQKAGLDKEYSMMLRTKFPGGDLTAEQFLFCLDMAAKYGQDDFRVTSRQDFQFHGVIKKNFRPLISDLNKLAKITSIGGCGDIVRNTMANPVADIDLRYKDCGADLVKMAHEIATATLPTTKAYYDLWLNDEKATVHEDGTVSFGEDLREVTEDPLYGTQYLPRKFKIGVGTDFDNSTDVYTQDVGIIAVTEQGRIIGYEIIAGGGLGFSHGRKDTYARAASHLAFVQEADVLPIVLAIVKVQRDFGDRTDRKLARLKYTIDRLGLDVFKAKVDDYAGKVFDGPRNVKPTDQPDYLGWHKQIQPGLNYVGVWVENGRVKDFNGSHQFKTGLRAVVDRFKTGVRVTAHHNLVLANIKDDDVDAVQAMLDEYKLPTDKGISTIRRLEMACPALPLCGLAQSEAERYLPTLMDAIEAGGHGDSDVIIRMTGCPNGCARSSSSEIGLVGKGVGRYTLLTGGCYNGTRLNEQLIATVKEEDLAGIMCGLLGLWKANRAEGERFGDWSKKLGPEKLRELLNTELGVEV